MTTYLSDHLDGLVMLLCNTRWRFYLYRTKLLLLQVMWNWLCNGTNVPKFICMATCCIDLWISKVKASTVPISCKYCWLRANKKRWLRNRTYTCQAHLMIFYWNILYIEDMVFWVLVNKKQNIGFLKRPKLTTYHKLR